MKRINKSDIILVCSVLAVIIYTVAAIILQWNTTVEISPTLTEKWYTFWTIEITALSGIKTVNILKGRDSKEDDPEDNLPMDSSNRKD